MGAVDERLLRISGAVASLSLIYAFFSVSAVDLRHVGIMLVLFGVAGLSLYGAFRVYRESKTKWLLFGVGFIVASATASQLTVKFDDPVSVVVAFLIALLILSLIATTQKVITLSKRSTLVLITPGGIIWQIAGAKALKNPHWDALPWVASGFIVIMSGVLFAQLDEKI